MAKLGVFNLITLDGFYKGRNEDISWHNFGEDEQKMSDELSNQGNTLLFGRVTYEMMVSYWTSQDALKNDPITAKGMNQAAKIVFSKTMTEARWQNTRLVKSDIVAEVNKLKNQPGPNMTILGSGQIVAQFADAGIIDEYSFLLNPIALGEGSSLFKGLTKNLKLNLKSTRTMKSGNVLLTYEK